MQASATVVAGECNYSCSRWQWGCKTKYGWCRIKLGTCKAADWVCRKTNIQCWDDYVKCGVEVAACETAKAACKVGCNAVDFIAWGALKAAEGIVKNSKWTVDFAQGVLDAAGVAMELAELTLKGIQKGFELALKVANWLIDMAGKLFRIKSIRFEAFMYFNDNFGETGFEVSAKFIVFGKDVDLKFSLNLNDIAASAKSLIASLFPGL